MAITYNPAFIELRVVPEPSALAFALVGGPLLDLRRRRWAGGAQAGNWMRS
jgi:hypothetical protein